MNTVKLLKWKRIRLHLKVKKVTFKKIHTRIIQNSILISKLCKMLSVIMLFDYQFNKIRSRFVRLVSLMKRKNRFFSLTQLFYHFILHDFYLLFFDISFINKTSFFQYIWQWNHVPCFLRQSRCGGLREYLKNFNINQNYSSKNITVSYIGKH